MEHINNLTGRSRRSPHQCPVPANSIASQLVRNGSYKVSDRRFSRLVAKEVSDLWKTNDTDDGSISGPFSTDEFTSALKRLQPGKALGTDSIFPELVLHVGTAMESWLRDFLSSCLRRLKIPKICRRSFVVAIPKPNKPPEDPKSYRTFFLGCVPFNILERLIHARVEPIIEPLLPCKQAGFRRGRSTVDQVTLLT